jgi:hypothetical protein
VRGDPGAQHAQQLDERRRRGWRTSKAHPSMVSRIANLTAAFGIAAAQANRLTGTLWCSTIAHTAADITLIAALTTTP